MGTESLAVRDWEEFDARCRGTELSGRRGIAGAWHGAALFFYSPDRKGEHPQAHLKDFRGDIHADGYARFTDMIYGGRIVKTACWAHVRRKFFDVHAATASPIAKEALDRIGQLYAVEKIVDGSPPERRRQQERQSGSQSRLPRHWLLGAEGTVRQLSRKSELPTTSGATGSQSSAIRHCPWSRAVYLPSGMRRRAG